MIFVFLLRNQSRHFGQRVLWQRQVCFLFHSKPGQPLEESIGRHLLHPAERSSVGLALLAHSDPPPKRRPRCAEILAEPTVPITNLDAALQGVRQLGYARLRFAQAGILSLGLPLGENPIAAIALSGPWAESETNRVVEQLRVTGRKILTDLQEAQTRVT